MTSDWLDPLPRPDAARTVLLERVELDARVMRSRRQGLSYAQIAEALRKGDADYHPLPDVTAEQVAKVCRGHLKRQAEETAESAVELRQLELERLDGLTRRWQPVAENSKATATEAAQATKIMLAISKRRAELAGLDAPKQHEVTVTGNILHELDLSEDALRREMEARAAEGFTVEGSAELDEVTP